jgi:hypothetical protein
MFGRYFLLAFGNPLHRWIKPDACVNDHDLSCVLSQIDEDGATRPFDVGRVDSYVFVFVGDEVVKLI